MNLTDKDVSNYLESCHCRPRTGREERKLVINKFVCSVNRPSVRPPDRSFFFGCPSVRWFAYPSISCRHSGSWVIRGRSFSAVLFFCMLCRLYVRPICSILPSDCPVFVHSFLRPSIRLLLRAHIHQSVRPSGVPHISGVVTSTL